MSKILGRILIDRITDGIDDNSRKEQTGFRSGRGTTEQIFILRNIIEQVNEWQATLYINFIDFEKSIRLNPQRKFMEHPEELWNTTKNHYNIKAIL